MPQTTNLDDTAYQQDGIDLVKELDASLHTFQVKLAAAYARLRIERRAAGQTTREQMENILPSDVREKEMMAVEMPKTLRVNTVKTTREKVAKDLQEKGYRVILQPFSKITSESKSYMKDDLICLDEDFEDLFVIPPKYFAEIKTSPLVSDGHLIFQDKASVYGPRHLQAFNLQGAHVIDARAGCGTKIIELSQLVGPKGKVFAFENRAGRLETLKANIKLFGCKNVTIVEEDFNIADTQALQFKKVSVVLLEPTNSGTAILDRLGFMLQEEEFPNEQYSLKDLYSLKRQQISILKHSFKFPKVNIVMYMTRSVHPEENEQVVTEVLERYGIDWELSCVLPFICSDSPSSTEINECLTIEPSEEVGNGIFIACFQKKQIQIEIEEPAPPQVVEQTASTKGVTESVSDLTISDIQKQGSGTRDGKAIRAKRKGSSKAKARSGAPIRLSKWISESVDRLSVPRLVNPTRRNNVKLRNPSSSWKKGEHDDAAYETSSNTGDNTQRGVFGDGTVDHIMLKRTNSRREIKKPEMEEDEYFLDNMGIFGVSLSKFYEPRNEALKLLTPENIKSRWSYPVPNPRPWK